MAEYWYSLPEFEERAKAFLDGEKNPEMTLSYDVKTKDFVNAGSASAEIKMVLKKLAVDPIILRRVAIASYEAEINIVAHSNGGKMEANIYHDFIHLIFRDNGPGLKDIEQAMVPGWSTADTYVREMGFGAGLGLPNIKKNSDALHIVSAENSSTILQVIIFFNK